jgi:hypothetical protein
LSRNDVFAAHVTRRTCLVDCLAHGSGSISDTYPEWVCRSSDALAEHLVLIVENDGLSFCAAAIDSDYGAPRRRCASCEKIWRSSL